MEGFKKAEALCNMSSQLLELASGDDLVGFRRAVEEEGFDIDGVGLWYGMRIGTKKMGLEERTPLMIAAMFGSADVLSYILESGCVDVNKMCGSDGATALHCGIAGGASSASRVIRLLLDASADCNLVGDYASNLDTSADCGIAGGASSASRVVRLLLDASADCNLVGDYISNLDTLIARVKPVVNFGEGFNDAELATDPFDQQLTGAEVEEQQQVSKDTLEKRDYYIDHSLPDIQNGIYGTDEFRMYTFKIKPCSRAYSHDWTECPFVHPGENARRRDPRKHHYSCVACPEFRKGTCRQGDGCEYAHGIFESWLHPAQYRTRLCKDETGCNRRVCFFAHKPEELRPLYASTGSGIPSPRSYSSASGQLDMSSLIPLVLGSPSVLIPSTSTPPMTPTGLSSPRSGSIWQNQSNLFGSNPSMSNSRLKSTLSDRNMDFDNNNQVNTESQNRRQQQSAEEMYGFSSPSRLNNEPFEGSSPFMSSPGARVGDFNRLMGRNSSKFEDMFAAADHSMISKLQNLSLDPNQSQMPYGIQMHHNQLHATYPSNLSSSPARSSSFASGLSLSSPPGAILTSRSTAFANRSRSFIERSPSNHNSGFLSPVSTAAAASSLHGWGSPTGKLEWGVQRDELSKLRKSSSFGIHSNGTRGGSVPGEPENSWVSPYAKETLPMHRLDEDDRTYSNGSPGSIPTWAEQMYLDQEQTVAH